MRGLGYYGADYNYPLIKDIAETWGDDCCGASENDTAYVLYNMAWKYYMGLGIAGVNRPPSGNAWEVRLRIEELDSGEISCLVRALANKSATKPLGYWGLSYDNKLIKDISETWNELQDISEVDQFWLISELSERYAELCQKDGDVISDEAWEVVDRMEEIDGGQIYAIIRTLAN